MVDAGDPITVDDFSAELDDHETRIGALEPAVEAAEVAIELLLSRFEADTVTDTTSLGGDIVVEFAGEFVAAPTVVVSPHGYANGPFVCAAFDKTTTGFTIRCLDMDGVAIASTELSVEWIATVA